MSHSGEIERIRREYARRREAIPAHFYSLTRPANLFMRHGQERAFLWALQAAGALPLAPMKVLEVGAGTGSWLGLLRHFGATPENLAAIELDPERVQTLKAAHPASDVRGGDASNLPWADAMFDIVFQATMFSSILDREVQLRAASEMVRVVRAGGCLIWYDFFVDNPANSNVRGIRRRDLGRLFPGFEITLKRTTLAPPLARWIVPRSWTVASLLEAGRFLNTHYMAVIRR